MKIYCKNCSKLMSFARFYCGAVIQSGGYERRYLNRWNDCPYYKKAKWRFWIALPVKEKE